MSSEVKPSDSFKTHINKTELETELINYVKNIKDYLVLKTDLELLIYICTKIENSQKTGVKYDKKDSVMKIYGTLFPLTADELKFIDTTINLLCKKGLIKKYSKYFSIGKSIFKKLVLGSV